MVGLRMTPDNVFHVRAEVDAHGFGTVELDGQDVSASLAGIEIVAHGGHATTVVLHPKRGSAAFDGPAVVQQAVPADMMEQFAQIVEAADAGTLERMALNRLDLETGDHAVTRGVLKALAEQIRGT